MNIILTFVTLSNCVLVYGNLVDVYTLMKKKIVNI